VDLNQSTIDMINQVIQVAIPALALLLALALAAVVGRQWVGVWHTARGYWPDIIESINEEDDLLIAWLARYAPALAPMIVKHGPAFFRALAEALDKLAEPDAPAVEVEVKVGEGVK
jgi:hypothetical protein